MGSEGIGFPDITSYERMGPYMDTSDVQATEQKVREIRPPRRRKSHTLGAVWSNLLRDLGEWFKHATRDKDLD